MEQVWHDLLFVHWPVPPDVLRGVVPRELPLDTYGGQAWIGVVPFRMSGVRLRGLPAIRGTAAFPELNVRTYVTQGGKPGVYFFSLDAGNPLAVQVARSWFHLPYYRARMSAEWRDGWLHYRSERTHRGAPSASLAARYRPTSEPEPAQPGSLADFLTSRYALYIARRGKVIRREIDHIAWPLQSAEAIIATNTMLDQIPLTIPETEPLLHFSRRLDVVVWPAETG
jgi:uncharacterized protein YqjF (DUF2071 family)